MISTIFPDSRFPLRTPYNITVPTGPSFCQALLREDIPQIPRTRSCTHGQTPSGSQHG